MPKFYVISGDFRCALNGTDPKSAALDAFARLEDSPVEELAEVTLVSEHGFESEAEDDFYICTMNLLEEADQLQNFHPKDWF